MTRVQYSSGLFFVVWFGLVCFGCLVFFFLLSFPFCEPRPPARKRKKNSPGVDLLGRVEELDARQVHPGRLPDLDHVAADSLDLLEVAAHLVVELREPVGDPVFVFRGA